MQNKKILIYFTQKEVADDPYAHIPERREIYWSIFREGKRRGYDVYLGVKPTIHHGGMVFENVLFFTGKKFEFKQEKVCFDAIYDRSIRSDFPTPEIDHKTLNSLSFKSLANDKSATYDFLKKYMPSTFAITSTDDFEKALAHFKPEELVVFKPVDGFGGKGIIILPASKLSPKALVPGKRFIMQKFIDTKGGVPGLAAGHHDIRVIIVHGQPIMVQVREPRAGELLANMSQGGSCQELPYQVLPSTIQTIVEQTHALIDKRFSSPLYSIDFGVDADETPYIFEINDQIGLKVISGQNKSVFCRALWDGLEERARYTY